MKFSIAAVLAFAAMAYAYPMVGNDGAYHLKSQC
jgi:hypothetical protein